MELDCIAGTTENNVRLWAKGDINDGGVVSLVGSVELFDLGIDMCVNGCVCVCEWMWVDVGACWFRWSAPTHSLLFSPYLHV